MRAGAHAPARTPSGQSRLLARFVHAHAARPFEVSHRLALDGPLVVLPTEELADIVRRLSSSSVQLRRPTPSGRAGRARRSGRCGSCGRATASHDQLGLNGAERLAHAQLKGAHAAACLASEKWPKAWRPRMNEQSKF